MKHLLATGAAVLLVGLSGVYVGFQLGVQNAPPPVVEGVDLVEHPRAPGRPCIRLRLKGGDSAIYCARMEV